MPFKPFTALSAIAQRCRGDFNECQTQGCSHSAIYEQQRFCNINAQIFYYALHVILQLTALRAQGNFESSIASQVTFTVLGPNMGQPTVMA